jgi:ABC-type Fe3+/spermidine/putrescine transport system ATPase subunit
MNRNIEFRNVAKSFGDVRALVDFAIRVDEGELVTLLGPSGCGKSTALRVAAGFEVCDSGDVLIGGASVVALPASKRGIGMVFQNYSLFPHLTVHENLEFGMKVRKMSRSQRSARVGELLDLVRLAGLAERYPHQISGGQQQRVALARALAIEPQVLLLDEPCSALDPISTAKIEELIAELKHDYTVVIVTHNMQQAARCSDYTAYMYLGDLVEVGETEQIFFKPKRQETEDYITGRFG